MRKELEKLMEQYAEFLAKVNGWTALISIPSNKREEYRTKARELLSLNKDVYLKVMNQHYELQSNGHKNPSYQTEKYLPIAEELKAGK